jgi:hypothetical protein
MGRVTVSESREESRVPYVNSGEAKIWYTEKGAGFPVLTLAPGGMRSSVPLWRWRRSTRWPHMPGSTR